MLIFLIQFPFSCKKESTQSKLKDALLGGWVNIIHADDTIIFYDSKAVIDDYDYNYSVEADSIYFKYIGTLEPYTNCGLQIFHYELSTGKDTLSFSNFDGLCIGGGLENTATFSKIK